jgi:hypothetical protein
MSKMDTFESSFVEIKNPNDESLGPIRIRFVKYVASFHIPSEIR